MRTTFQNSRTRLAMAAVAFLALGAAFFVVAPASHDVLGQTGPFSDPSGVNIVTPFVVGGVVIPANCISTSFGNVQTITPGTTVCILAGGVIIGVRNSGCGDIVATPKALDSTGQAALVISVQFPSCFRGTARVELFRQGSQASDVTIDCTTNPCEVSVPDGFTAVVTF